MGNGVSACTGLTGAQMLDMMPIRRFSTRLGSEAIRVGEALGFSSRRSCICRPRPSPGPARATRRRCVPATNNDRGQQGHSADQRPSMGQDMQKGRRTEIEFLNGYVVREGDKARLHAVPTPRSPNRQAGRAGRIGAGPPPYQRVAAELIPCASWGAPAGTAPWGWPLVQPGAAALVDLPAPAIAPQTLPCSNGMRCCITWSKLTTQLPALIKDGNPPPRYGVDQEILDVLECLH